MWLGSVGLNSADANGRNGIRYNGGRLVGVGDGVASVGDAGAEISGSKIYAPSQDEIETIVNSPDLDRPGMITAIGDLYKQ